MKYAPHQLDSASIDRLDATIGYIDSNIQLVCQFVNLAKNDHPTTNLVALLEKYAAKKYGHDSYEVSTQND